MNELMNELKPAMIIRNPRIAFDHEGYACPLERNKPAKDWCIMRIKGSYAQLVPVSPDPIDDDKRDGCMMKTKPIITQDGRRLFLCTGFPIIRHVHEIAPPGYLPNSTTYALQSGFENALKSTFDFFPPEQEPDLGGVNWHALYFMKGALCSRLSVGGGWWKKVKAQKLLEDLEEYEPPVENGDEIVNSIRNYLAENKDKVVMELLF